MLGLVRGRSSRVCRIGKDCRIEGNFEVDGPLQIDGAVCGLVKVRGDVTISETGLVEGIELRGENITVQGVLRAQVYAAGKLTLVGTSRLEGNAIAGSIEVLPGAYYTGHLSTRDSRTPFYPQLAAGSSLNTASVRSANQRPVNQKPLEGLSSAGSPEGKPGYGLESSRQTPTSSVVLDSSESTLGSLGQRRLATANSAIPSWQPTCQYPLRIPMASQKLGEKPRFEAILPPTASPAGMGQASVRPLSFSSAVGKNPLFDQTTQATEDIPAQPTADQSLQPSSGNRTTNLSKQPLNSQR